MTQAPASAAGPARVTAAEIAAAMGITKARVHKRATEERWDSVNGRRDSLGGSKKYFPTATLPAPVREALAARAVTAAATQLGLPAPAPRGTALALVASRAVATADHALAHYEAPQPAQDAGTARTIVMGRVQALTEQYRCSRRRAIELLLAAARSGELAHNVVVLLKRARDARGRGKSADGLPSLKTLERWLGQKDDGRSPVPLPSTPLAEMKSLKWYAPFFALTDRPQKPTFKLAHEQLLAAWRPEWADPAGAPPPSYDAAVRAYNKRSKIDQIKGRNTGSALRAKSYYHRRTYDGLAPFTEVHADGWCSHFTAPHPVTGEFRTMEVWHYRDVATRYVPPFAIGRSENTDVILEGLQHCIRLGGVPAVLQYDHTSSVKNARVMDEHAGLAERLGISVVHPAEVGNSQANGMSENFNTYLDREARALATYQHPDRMDSATFVKVRRITNQMVRAAGKPAERDALRREAMRIGKGIVLDTDAEAVAWLEAARQKWNNHPCRELPKVRSPETGRLVHLTPQQSLDAAIAAGWEPVALNEAQLVAEFRPHLKKIIRRGTVTPYGKVRYHSPELAHHEGEEVLVAVDRDNPEAVWVKSLDGVLIAQAGFVADVPSRSQSMREHSEAKRARAQIRLREQQIDAIEARIAPPALEMDDGYRWIDMPDGMDEVGQRRQENAMTELRQRAETAPDEVDPMEVYLQRRLAERRAAEAQAALDGLARIEAAMKKAAEEAAARDDDDTDFEVTAGR